MGHLAPRTPVFKRLLMGSQAIMLGSGVQSWTRLQFTKLTRNWRRPHHPIGWCCWGYCCWGDLRGAASHPDLACSPVTAPSAAELSDKLLGII